MSAGSGRRLSAFDLIRDPGDGPTERFIAPVSEALFKLQLNAQSRIGMYPGLQQSTDLHVYLDHALQDLVVQLRGFVAASGGRPVSYRAECPSMVTFEHRDVRPDRWQDDLWQALGRLLLDLAFPMPEWLYRRLHALSLHVLKNKVQRRVRVERFTKRCGGHVQGEVTAYTRICPHISTGRPGGDVVHFQWLDGDDSPVAYEPAPRRIKA